MPNVENEKEVLRENASNFFNWMGEAKKRLSEEEAKLSAKQVKPSEKRSDRAA